ncbi:MAG: protein kinase [Planctomycetes bacterium]|nr:protein kinase [Planctomycetota bacterium]
MTDPDPLESVFFAALERAPENRPAFLEEACRGTPGLRERVERLLAAKQQIGDFLQPPAIANAFTAAPEGPAQNVPGKDEQVGTVLGGKYKLMEEIGEGGMGRVYMAQQKEPIRRAVAVKVIKAGMDSKAVLARFEAERQALAMMDHPNIARVLDAGTTESGRPFFVLELVKGVPITQYCDERKLTPRQRLELFVPVCQALQHAHQKGVIHRDLKPSNVMVALYDDKAVPKVIDFGVAKATGQALTDKTLMTGFGAVVGTPEYMSPEQANLNNLDVDTRSDVYSLGVLLYELLTGSTPVDRKSIGKAALMEILRVVREVEAPRPSVKLSTCDALPSVAAARGTEPAKLSKLMKGELDWVLLKALEKDRTRRYETANGLAADIQRYLSNEPVAARPPSTAYRLQKAWQRNKLVFVAGAAIAASLVIGITLSIWQTVRADREATRAVASLEELRATAPAFAEQARVRAAKDQFEDALEKLAYAAKLRPDVPEYLIAKGDLLQCQFRLAEAATAYRAALALSADDARAKASAELCEELLAAPLDKDGKLTRENLSKLHVAMQQQQRPAAELMPVARLLGEEKKLVVAYWLERLKGLPVSFDKPLARRLSVRDDGLLALDLSGTRIADLKPLIAMPLGSLNLTRCAQIIDFGPLNELRALTSLLLDHTKIGTLSPLRGLPLVSLDVDDTQIFDVSDLRGMKLKRLSIRDTRVSDLSPLAGMPLTYFDATSIPATDYSPLAGAPLGSLFIQNSPIRDLSFLEGSPVKELVLYGCNSARGFGVCSKLKSLNLLVLPSSYRELPDEELAAIAALRTHPTLRNIEESRWEGTRMFWTAQSKDAFWKIWDRERSLVSAVRKTGFQFRLTRRPNGTYELSIEDQPLSDLSFLKGAPISELWLNNCKVTDLAPIQDLPIRILGLHANPVTDLSPLRKMPLVELSIEETKVSDLSPLTGLRLKKLYLHDCENLTDVSLLAEISTLEKLTVPVRAQNMVKLRDLPNLKLLAFGMSDRSPYFPVSTTAQFWAEYEKLDWIRSLQNAGFTPKRQTRLSDGTWELDLSQSGIVDLSILRGAPISVLWLMETDVSDLEPLRGMALKSLLLYKTKVTDLSPLQGMPLTGLNLVATKVSDLSALRELPLTYLRLNQCTEITDLSPLADIKTLTNLTLPPGAKDFEFLRAFPKLERLSYEEDPSNSYRPDKTAAEFWQEHDAKKK